MTNVYDVGDQAALATLVTVNGTPTDATVTLTVTAPDGTVSTPSVTHAGVGSYTATVPVTQAGLWLYRWVASGTAVAVDEGQFTARPAGLRIVSLGEAKTHLNKTGTTDDEELRGFVDAAGAVMRELAGPVMPETIVERHDGGYPQLLLRMPPVLSVTSIVENYAGVNNTLTLEADLGVGSVSGYDFTLDDPATGLVTRRSYGNTSCFFPGVRNIKVTYQAGRASVPWNIRLATLELIAHLWRSSQLGRGGNRAGHGGNRTALGGEDVLVTAFGYAVPNRVVELLGSDRRPAVMSR